MALKQFIRLLVYTMVVNCGCANLPNNQQTQAAVSAITLVPSSGKGQSAVVTVKVIPGGVLRRVGILYNAELDGRNACYIFYNPAENSFGLVKDSGSGTESLIAGKPLVGNSQCALAGADNTRAEIRNNVLAICLAITFKPAFAGSRNIYVYEEYNDGRKPTFQKEGTWLVTNEPQPGANVQPITLVPSSGEGQNAVFTVSLAPADVVRTVGVLYNASMEGRAACYIYYDAAKHIFGLIRDSGDSVEWLIAGGPLVENSQCALSGAGATRAEINGNVLALSLAITFKPAFAGSRNVYVYEEYKDGGKPTFRQEGTWLVAP